MKVLHIVWSSNIGGIENVVLQLAVAQKHASIIEPTIFAAKSDGPLIQKAIENNISIIKGEFKKGDLNLFKLSNCISIFNEFDIIHIHSFNPIVALATIKSNKKIVHTEHGNFGFERKKGLGESISKKLQSIFLKKYVNTITANSEFSKTIASEKYNLENSKIKVVYNGVAIPKQLSEKSKNNKFRIGFIGRIVEVKRLDRLIELAENLQSNNNFIIEIIGDGPLRNQVEQTIKQKRLTDLFHFLGYQTNTSEYYSQWDLLVAPSTNEAFGLVAIEAYAHGCPVAVMHDGGGLQELVKNCEPEMVFHNIKDLADYIQKSQSGIINNNETNQRNNRKAFASKFTIEKMEAAMYQVYLSL